MASIPTVRVDPCSKSQLAKHPPLDGRTNLAAVAGVEGIHCTDGDGVRGISYEGNGVNGRGALYGVVGDGFQDGCGMFGFSVTGQGIRGETQSRKFAAVTGIARYSKKNADEPDQGIPSPGVWGASTYGVGVHGESHSTFYAAVEGIQLNVESAGPGIYGEHRGSGAGGVFRSDTGEGVHGVTHSPDFAAVAGVSSFTPPLDRAGEKFAAPGLWGSSKVGHGLYAESWSPHFAAVAGIQRNQDRAGAGAGIYGENMGNGPAGFFKGKVFVTDDIELINGDCAEDFDIAGEIAVEPGTVMTFDANGALQPSVKAYDKAVAGIVSGAGDFKPAIVLGKRSESGSKRVPIALLGKVWCKVDASLAPIVVGDLLTTSSTAGHAMKAEDRRRSFGAVIGKALAPLAGGIGLIPVLVALQ